MPIDKKTLDWINSESGVINKLLLLDTEIECMVDPGLIGKKKENIVKDAIKQS